LPGQARPRVGAAAAAGIAARPAGDPGALGRSGPRAHLGAGRGRVAECLLTAFAAGSTITQRGACHTPNILPHPNWRFPPMNRCLAVAVLALFAVAAPLSAAGITGQYVEARTCDVWTGACFANAEMNLTGKNAVLGWKVEKGALDNVALDGLGVVAVVQAT